MDCTLAPVPGPRSMCHHRGMRYSTVMARLLAAGLLLSACEDTDASAPDGGAAGDDASVDASHADGGVALPDSATSADAAMPTPDGAAADLGGESREDGGEPPDASEPPHATGADGGSVFDAGGADPDTTVGDPDAATPPPDGDLPSPDVATDDGGADPDAAALDPDAAALDPDAAALDPDAAALDPDAAALDPDMAAPDPDMAAPDPDAAVPDMAAPMASAVELSLDPVQTAAGAVTTATCVVLDQFGSPLEAETVLEVAPPEGVTIEGGELTATRALEGAYTVTCRLAGGDLADHAPWTVVPGPAATLEASAQPALVGTRESTTVTLHAADAFGNEVAVEPSFEVVAGQGLITASDGNELTLAGSGPLTIRVTVLGSEITAEFTVEVDAVPPTVLLDAPALDGFHPLDVPVRGTAADDVGILRVTVDGIEVDVAEDGTFEAASPAPRAGLHVLEVVAVDRIGKETSRQRAVLAGTFRAPGEWLERALRVGLNPGYYDDDLPDLDDVAAQAEAAFDPATVQLGAIQGCRVDREVALTALRVASHHVDVTPAGGRLDATLTLMGVEIDYEGRACGRTPLGCQCTQIAGTATAESATAAGSIDLVAEDCGVSGTAGNTSADIQNLDLHQDDQVEALLSGPATAEIEARLATAFEAQLQELASRLGAAFVLPDTLSLPPPQEVQLPQEHCFTEASLDNQGTHFDASVRYPAETAIELPAGAGAFHVDHPVPATRGPDDIHVVLDLDLLNTLFFDAWRAGTPLQLGGAFEVAQRLPIVLVAHEDVVDVTLTALEVNTVVLGVELQVSVSVIIPAAVTVFPEGGAGLVLTDDPDEVMSWAEVVSPDDLGAQEAFVRDQVVDALQQDALPSLLGGVIPLPFDRFGGAPLGDPTASLLQDFVRITGQATAPLP